MAFERIFILCTGGIPDEESAIKCAMDTLSLMTYPIGEPGKAMSICGYDWGCTIDGENICREKGEPIVARADSEYGKKWIKGALEGGYSFLRLPFFTLSANKVKSKKQLNEILKNGSEWFNDEELKKIKSGEKDESSSVFIVPVHVHFVGNGALLYQVSMNEKGRRKNGQ